MLWSNWSIGTQTFWAMFAASSSLLLLGSLALSTVEQNMVVIRHEDEQIQQLHSRLQQALGDQYPSSEELGEVQQALQLALQKYRQYCASPELLSAVMRLRKLQKKLPL